MTVNRSSIKANEVCVSYQIKVVILGELCLGTTNVIKVLTKYSVVDVY